METLVANFDVILGALILIVSGVAAIVKLTPTPKDDEIVGKIHKGLLLVQSFFSARPKK